MMREKIMSHFRCSLFSGWFSGRFSGVYGRAVLGFVAIGLVGCFGDYRGDMVSANLNSLLKKKQAQVLAEALEDSPLRFKVNFVADAIVPSGHDFLKTGIVKHSYEEDRLPGNATGFVKGRLAHALKAHRPVAANENPKSGQNTKENTRKNLRNVSMDLQEIDLKILHGNFISGRYGRYFARVKGQVRVSGSDGKVYMNEPVSAEFQGSRQSFAGEEPDLDQDWHNIKLALMRAVDILALEITQKLTEDDEESELNVKTKEHNTQQDITPSVFAP